MNKKEIMKGDVIIKSPNFLIRIPVAEKNPENDDWLLFYCEEYEKLLSQIQRFSAIPNQFILIAWQREDKPVFTYERTWSHCSKGISRVSEGTMLDLILKGDQYKGELYTVLTYIPNRLNEVIKDGRKNKEEAEKLNREYEKRTKVHK